MMNFFLLPLIVSLFIAGPPAKIVNDVSFLGSLKPTASMTKEIKLHGKTVVDIDVKAHGKLISCEFIDQSGMVGLVQTEVETCLGHLETSNPMTLTVRVTNPNKCDEVDFAIHWVESEKVSQ